MASCKSICAVKPDSTNSQISEESLNCIRVVHTYHISLKNLTRDSILQVHPQDKMGVEWQSAPNQSGCRGTHCLFLELNCTQRNQEVLESPWTIGCACNIQVLFKSKAPPNLHKLMATLKKILECLSQYYCRLHCPCIPDVNNDPCKPLTQIFVITGMEILFEYWNIQVRAWNGRFIIQAQ